MLPISLVLATLSERYVDGLMAYRFDGQPGSSPAFGAVERWLDTFLDATLVATDQAMTIAAEIAQLRQDWADRVAAHRLGQGLREIPRSDSATSRILAALPEMPVLTTATAQRVLRLSFPSARGALEELADAAVLHRKAVGRGVTGYLCRDVLDLVGLAERRLASTRFDTRASPPRRPVPDLPHA